MQTDEKLLLNVREAGHMLSISPWTVRRYISTGKLRPTRIGRRVLVEPAELQRLVEAGRRPRVRPRT
jgi:excisionase family DNA binding protein